MKPFGWFLFGEQFPCRGTTIFLSKVKRGKKVHEGEERQGYQGVLVLGN